MSDYYSLIIKNGSCYIDGKLIKSDIGLYENKIQKIGKLEENNCKVYDGSGKVILPGIIDTQVHFREKRRNLSKWRRCKRLSPKYNY